jgi:HAMP domain-containing protein
MGTALDAGRWILPMPQPFDQTDARSAEPRFGEKTVTPVVSEPITGIQWVVGAGGRLARRVRITGRELDHIDLRRPKPTATDEETRPPPPN